MCLFVGSLGGFAVVFVLFLLFPYSENSVTGFIGPVWLGLPSSLSDSSSNVKEFVKQYVNVTHIRSCPWPLRVS